MSDTKSKFIREYKRQSKSIFEDHSTNLILADYECKTEGEISLSFDRYIYLHRDSASRILGISISNALLEANPEFTTRYLSDIDMYIFLLLYIEDIAAFCQLFSDEFASLFGLHPDAYFEAAVGDWIKRLNEA